MYLLATNYCTTEELRKEIILERFQYLASHVIVGVQ